MTLEIVRSAPERKCRQQQDARQHDRSAQRRQKRLRDRDERKADQHDDRQLQRDDQQPPRRGRQIDVLRLRTDGKARSANSRPSNLRHAQHADPKRRRQMAAAPQ